MLISPVNYFTTLSQGDSSVIFVNENENGENEIITNLLTKTKTKTKK